MKAAKQHHDDMVFPIDDLDEDQPLSESPPPPRADVQGVGGRILMAPMPDRRPALRTRAEEAIAHHARRLG